MSTSNELSSEALLSTLLWSNKQAKRVNLSLSVCGLSNVNIEQQTHYLVYRIDNVLNGKHYIG